MNIFDRLPLGLFGPLTGRNGRRMWDLIGRLAQQFFGPDCIPPYAEGYLHEQITKEIERFLHGLADRGPGRRARVREHAARGGTVF
jgi:hypothetical protein